MKPLLCAIAGVDGAGKSTIVDHLKHELPATYIKEPYYPTYIEQITSTTDIFDKVALFAMDRFNLYKDIQFPLVQTIISDRSYICSLVYQSLELEQKYGWTPFRSISYIHNAQLAIIVPDIVLFIHADPSVIHHRLHNRSHEHHMTAKQINAIQQRYKLIFDLFNFNVHYIDTTIQSVSINVSRIISIINEHSTTPDNKM